MQAVVCPFEIDGHVSRGALGGVIVQLDASGCGSKDTL